MCTGNRTRTFWECLCTRCGSTGFMESFNIRSGNTTACICGKSQKGRISTRVYQIDQRAVAINVLFCLYRKQAEKRGHSWNLGIPEFAAITSKNCHYCGIEPLQTQAYRSSKIVVPDAYLYNGIDRVDNKSGYEPKNCVPCCGACNWTKLDHSVEEFLAFISRIYKHSIAA